MLGLADLELHSGRGRVSDHGIVVDYADPEGAPLDDGFKLVWLEALKRRGRPVVYIGDGEPDIEAALRADHVIARDDLERHFRDRSLPHFAFDTFHDVRRIVEAEIVGKRTG
jgi:2-hydroxy-3-keto-5-methylthiopentenyl-1-phosphate phosphatase